jgi:hypothetical protein
MRPGLPSSSTAVAAGKDGGVAVQRVPGRRTGLPAPAGDPPADAAYALNDCPAQRGCRSRVRPNKRAPRSSRPRRSQGTTCSRLPRRAPGARSPGGASVAFMQGQPPRQVEQAAILISWRFFGDLGRRIWLARAKSCATASVYGTEGQRFESSRARCRKGSGKPNPWLEYIGSGRGVGPHD